MVRTFIGGIVGGLILFVWASSSGRRRSARYPLTSAPDAQSAGVQLSLTRISPQPAPAPIIIPDTHSREGAMLYAQGPIATIYLQHAGLFARRHVDAAARAYRRRRRRAADGLRPRRGRRRRAQLRRHRAARRPVLARPSRSGSSWRARSSTISAGATGSIPSSRRVGGAHPRRPGHRALVPAEAAAAAPAPAEAPAET